MKRMKRFISFMVILSALLTIFHSGYWAYFTLFIGLNILQWSYTNWCPAEKIMNSLFGPERP